MADNDGLELPTREEIFLRAMSIVEAIEDQLDLLVRDADVQLATSRGRAGRIRFGRGSKRSAFAVPPCANLQLDQPLLGQRIRLAARISTAADLGAFAAPACVVTPDCYVANRGSPERQRRETMNVLSRHARQVIKDHGITVREYNFPRIRGTRCKLVW